ncbi:MAG: DUF899 family protein [Streptosporangiaceae bacterium]
MRALGGLAVSYAAIAALVTGRGWVIATIAALLGGLRAFAGAMLNVLGGISLAAAASAHMTQIAAARFLVTSFGSGPAQVAGYIYFASEYAAPVVMGYTRLRTWRNGTSRPALSCATGDDVYRTQSTTARGVDRLIFVSNILDLTPYGRQEDRADSSPGRLI